MIPPCGTPECSVLDSDNISPIFILWDLFDKKDKIKFDTTYLGFFYFIKKGCKVYHIGSTDLIDLVNEARYRM